VTEKFKREPTTVGYSAVPHGLWTADVSHGARNLLGWLHSHTDTYLESLSVNRCEEVFNSGSVRVWMKELETAGFIKKTKRGQRYVIELIAEPWDTLRRRRHPADTAPRFPRDNPAETAPIEDQIGNQLAIEQSSIARAVPKPLSDHRLLYNAVLEACGMDHDEMTKEARRIAGMRVRELLATGATPDMVPERAENYHAHFENAAMTPAALIKHWAMCANPPRRRTRQTGGMGYLQDRMAQLRADEAKEKDP